MILKVSLVLKDASATADWFCDANGVIIITTKRVAEGKLKINISTFFTTLTPNNP